MHWRKLVEASRLYRTLEARDRFYWSYREAERTAWQSPKPELENCKKLITFLNQWSTHTPLTPPQVQLVFESLYSMLCELRTIHFVDLKDSHLGAIQDAFDKVAQSGERRYESTGAAKILHIWAPNSLVMWDAAISAGYGIYRDATAPRPSGKDYAFTFLPRLQAEASEAIGTCMVEKGLDRKEAVQAIEESACREPFTKLLDEYNYAKYTLSADSLWKS